MDENEKLSAWNNMVANADPSAFERNDMRRAAAIACRFMGSASNGGLNGFLTVAHDLDASEVLASIEGIGAHFAAAEFQVVLDGLGGSLPAATQDERWDQLDELWTDQLDEFDILTVEADRDLVVALEKHVEEFSSYYLRQS